MNKQKSKLYIIGCTVIGISALLLIYFVLVFAGLVHVTQNKLVFTSGSAEKIYDGTPLTCDEWRFSEGRLQTGHHVQAVLSGTVTLPGTVPNTLYVKILDDQGLDVTGEYEIECRPGNLTVFGLPLVFESGSASKPYDGTPLSSDACVLASGALMEGHVYEAVSVGMITEVGSVSNLIQVKIYDEKTGEDVSIFYDIELHHGTLTILGEGQTDPIGGNSGGGNGGGGAAGSVTGDINDANKNPQDTGVLFEVATNRAGQLLLRQMVYGNYLGNGWAKDPGWENNTIGMDPDFLTALALKDSGFATDTLQIAFRTSCGYMAPYYYTGGELEALREGFKEGRIYFGSYIPFAFERESYGTLTDAYAVEEEIYRSFVYETYLSLPATTVDAMRSIAREAGLDTDADREKLIRAVASYIRKAATYNMNYAPYPEGVDTAVYFLTEAKEGVCRHYATAAVAMYRALGIPARYAVGYSVTSTGRGWVAVEGKNGHAWAEVYVDGLGWVSVDPTGGSGGLGGEGGGGGEDGPTSAMAPEETDNLNNRGSGGGGGNGNSLLFIYVSDSSGKLLFRQRSYGDYKKVSWGAATAYRGSTLPWNPLNAAAMTLQETQDGRYATIRILMAGDATYLSPYYQVLHDLSAGSGDVYVEKTMYSQYMYQLSYLPFDYLDNAGLTRPLDPWALGAKDYESFVHGEYLELPADTREQIEAIILAQGFADIPNQRQLIRAVRDYVRNAAVYNEEYADYPEDVDTAIYFLTESKEGVCRHFATAATVLYRALGIPARYTVGYSSYATAGKEIEVTTQQGHAWVEIYLDNIGWVAIDPTPSQVDEDEAWTLSPEALEKEYDGTPLSAVGADVKLRGGALLPGHTIVAEVEGEITEVGTGLSRIVSYRVLDADGNDVTDQYPIRPETGSLTVYPISLEVTTGGGSKSYDGTPLVNPDWQLTEGKVLPGHTLLAGTTGSITKVGLLFNTLAWDVVDAEGRSVAHCYKMQVVSGVLGVLPADLTVKAQSTTMIYTPPTGEAEPGYDTVSFPKYDLEGVFPEGHTLAVDFLNVPYSVGLYDNVILGVTVYNAQGEDVTNCFSIHYVNGQIKILPPT